MSKPLALALALTLLAGCGGAPNPPGATDPAGEAPGPTTWAAARDRLVDANSGTFRVETSAVPCAADPVPPCSYEDVQIVQTGSFTIEPASTDWEHRVTNAGNVTTVRSRTTARGETFNWLSSASAPSSCWFALDDPMEKYLTGSVLPIGLVILLAADEDDSDRDGAGTTERPASAPAELVLPHLGGVRAADAYRGSIVPITVRMTPTGDPLGFTADGATVAAALTRVEPHPSTSAADLVVAAGRRSTFTLDHVGTDPQIGPPDDDDIERSDRWPNGTCTQGR